MPPLEAVQTQPASTRVFNNKSILSNIYAFVSTPALLSCLTLQRDGFETAAKELYKDTYITTMYHLVDVACPPVSLPH